MNTPDRLIPSTPTASERSAIHARQDSEGPTSQSVARGMNAVLRQGGGSLTMKLSPASLGDVRIEMTMQAGRVSVQFDVGSIAAYEAIKGQLTELKQTLEQRGMTVERVETHVSPALARSAQSEGNPNQRQGDQPGSPDQGQHRHDAANGESRGKTGSGEGSPNGNSTNPAAPDDAEAESDFELTLNIGIDATA